MNEMKNQATVECKLNIVNLDEALEKAIKLNELLDRAEEKARLLNEKL